jgi:DNA-binding MarR family transcriptional regulator
MRARLRRQRNNGSLAGPVVTDAFVRKSVRHESLISVTTNRKYVNMADINFPALDDPPAAVPGNRAGRDLEAIWDIIELLFFAYRDFVSDPDDALAKFSFGRAHHRVLHFVNRNPGMKVAELLDILKITKQSLGRVLKQLIDQGYVLQKEGANDRRQRLLFVTPKGEALALKLAALQSDRIARALSELGPNAHEAACRFLVAMIDVDNRDGVLRFIARAGRARRRRA